MQCNTSMNSFKLDLMLDLYRVYTKQKSSSSSFCYFDDDQGLA